MKWEVEVELSGSCSWDFFGHVGQFDFAKTRLARATPIRLHGCTYNYHSQYSILGFHS
jgi:hypothetical protein